MPASSSSSSDEAPANEFRVNTAFAARYDETSRRAQDQRKADLIASAPIPERVLRTFTSAIAAAAKTASFALSVISVVSVVAREHRLNVGAAAAAKLRGAEPAEGSSAAVDVERFLAGGPGRAVVAKLLRWARAVAHQTRAARPPLPPPQARKAGRYAGTPVVGTPLHPAMSAAAASAVASLSEHAKATAAAAAAAATEAAAAAASAAAVAAYIASRKRGRGAGSGRGLDPTSGEPLFQDLHPSWRARRIVRAAQRKLINTDLRSKPTTEATSE